MKIAISGKGGVGKTTITANLVLSLSRDGYKVLAVDCDPNTTLATALGLSHHEASKIIPLSENYDLIENRTGSRPGSFGGIFRMNPKVDDLIENFSVPIQDVNLMVMGTVKSAEGGCVCPANILIKALLSHLIVERAEFVVLDMVAGIEHLGRGTAKNVDLMLIVTEPSLQSILTVERVKNLSSDLGIPKIGIIGNKVNSKRQEAFLMEKVNELGLGDLLAVIPFDESIVESNIQGKALIDFDENSNALKAILELKNKILDSFY